MSSPHAESESRWNLTDWVVSTSMWGFQLWIIMTNITDLSSPANAMYRTVWAGCLPCDIISSAATHQHLMQAGAPLLWCPSSIVIQILRPILCVCVCVWYTGEDKDESPPLCHPHLFPHYCLVRQGEWNGARFFRVTHPNSRFRFPLGLWVSWNTASQYQIHGLFQLTKCNILIKVLVLRVKSFIWVQWNVKFMQTLIIY